MTVFQAIITAISLLLPTAGPVAARPTGPESSLAALVGTIDQSRCVIQRRSDFPSPSRLFLESLDETAFDEEDTNEIDISAVISQVVFGENSFPTALLDPSSPQRLHWLPQPTQAVLRC